MNRKNLTAVCLCLSLILLSSPKLSTAVVSVGFSANKTCFSVTYRGETSPYNVTPLFVLPKERVQIEIKSDDPDAKFQVDSKAWSRVSSQSWVWTAPRKPGFYPTRIFETISGETMDLSVFVMVPYGRLKSDRLNGYRIGKYPRIPVSKQALYALPRGFVEVTKENKDQLISPHFRLGQFVCKQGGSYPKYVVLREPLLIKLETTLERVNAEGIPAKTFHVMSGYRTPYYNKAIGNVKYSRHLWGDAADIYINSDSSALGMEDLNGDGRADKEDAEVLYRIVEKIEEQSVFKQLVGGVGLYRSTREHGPFVHIDTRGKQARWGKT